MEKYIENKNGIITINCPDLITERIAADFIEKYTDLINKTIPVKVFYNLENWEYLPENRTKKILVNGFKNVRKPHKDDKVAMYARKKFILIATKALLVLTRRLSEVKVFDDKHKAIEWLNSEEQIIILSKQSLS